MRLDDYTLGTSLFFPTPTRPANDDREASKTKAHKSTDVTVDKHRSAASFARVSYTVYRQRDERPNTFGELRPRHSENIGALFKN